MISSFAVGGTILSPVTMIVFFFAEVFGYILSTTDRRTGKFYNFLMGLAWTHLLGILIATLSFFAFYVNGIKRVGDDPHCHFHCLTMTNDNDDGTETLLILYATPVERSLALKCVSFYSRKCRSGTERVSIFVTWMTVILPCLLLLFGFGRFETVPLNPVLLRFSLFYLKLNYLIRHEYTYCI